MLLAAWIDALPGPVVLVVCVALGVLVLWWALTRSEKQLRAEKNESTPGQPLGSAIYRVLPVPAARVLAVLTGLLLIGFGIAAAL